MASRHTTLIQSDAPVSVTVDSSVDQTWFRLFRALIHGGHLAQLTPAATKVLIVLAESVNDATRRDTGAWIAWPSLDTIASRAGCSRKAVTVAVTELETRKLLRRRQGGGRHTTQYELIAPVNPASQPPVKPTSQATVKPASRQARRASHSTDEASFTRQRKTTEIDQPSSNSPEAARQLAAAGVREPMLGRLLREFDEAELLLRLMDWNTRKTAGQSKPVAWLISSILQKYDLHPKTIAWQERQEQSAARRIRDERLRQAESDEQARQDELDRQVSELFEASTDEELAGWAKQAVAEYGGLAKYVEGSDVRANRRLSRLIMGLMARQFAETA